MLPNSYIQSGSKQTQESIPPNANITEVWWMCAQSKTNKQKKQPNTHVHVTSKSLKDATVHLVSASQSWRHKIFTAAGACHGVLCQGQVAVFLSRNPHWKHNNKTQWNMALMLPVWLRMNCYTWHTGSRKTHFPSGVFFFLFGYQDTTNLFFIGICFWIFATTKLQSHDLLLENVIRSSLNLVDSKEDLIKFWAHRPFNNQHANKYTCRRGKYLHLHLFTQH